MFTPPAVAQPPTFRAAETATTPFPSTSLTIATPAGVVPGELLLAGLTARIPDFMPLIAPEGWTLIRRESNDPLFASLSQAIYYRVADGTEASSYTWRWPALVPAAGGILTYGGVDRAQPIDAHSGSYRSWTGEIVAPSVAAAEPDSAAIAFFGYDGAKTTTPPADMVERYDVAPIGGFSATAAAADRIPAGPGMTASAAATIEDGSSSTIGQLVVLRPSAPLAPVNTSPADDLRHHASRRAADCDARNVVEHGAAELGYQWRRCKILGADCSDIAGATGSSYLVGGGDVGSVLLVQVTAATSAGSASAVSKPTSIVAPAIDPSILVGRLYAATSPFNQRVPSGAPIDPNSQTMVNGLVQAATNAGALVAVKRYSTPIYYADASTPRHHVRLTAEWRASDYLLDVPIPANATPADGSDRHMVVIDQARGCEYDFFGTYHLADGWEAKWANALPLTSQGIYEKGLSARGSGFALGAGLIRPDELRNPDGTPGRIPHALVFNTPYVKAGGPVPPATESDGDSTSAYAIPEGAYLQLDPNFDVSTLAHPYERVIARALQEFGAYVGDVSGSSIDFYAEDPRGHASNPYAEIWGDETYVGLPTALIENLRVLALPPQFVPNYDIVPNGCNHFG
jgi:hypothetical protein